MIYFLLYLFVEIYVSVKIASAIGPFWTFVEVVATAAYGVWVLANMHIQMQATMRALMLGEMSVEEFEQMQIGMVVGAILLIIPGFFTDILCILLHFGAIGRFIAKRIFRLKSRPREDDDVIDVEIIER